MDWKITANYLQGKLSYNHKNSISEYKLTNTQLEEKIYGEKIPRRKKGVSE